MSNLVNYRPAKGVSQNLGKPDGGLEPVGFHKTRSLIRAISVALIAAALLCLSLSLVWVQPVLADGPINLNIGTLPKGKTITITFQATVTNPLLVPGDRITNTAVVSGTNFAPIVTDDPDTPTPNDPTVTLMSLPDLTTSKANSAGGSVGVNEVFTWTVNVTNTGSADAVFTDNQVILQDNLPNSDATYGTPSVVNVTNVTNSGEISCSIDGSQNLICKVAPMGIPVTISDTNGSFAVTIPVTPTAAGSLENPRAMSICRADPNGNVTESNESNNNCNVDTVTVVAPDLTIGKANDTGGLIALGNSFIWTVTVTNTGDANAAFTDSQIILQDNLPNSDATYGTPSVVNVTNVTNPGEISCSIDGSQNLVCKVAPMGVPVIISDTNGSFAVTVPVTPTVTGTLENPRSMSVCRVDPDGNVTESNESNNNCNVDSVNVTLFADLGLSKTVSNSNPKEGDVISYTVVISNAGPSGATAVVVSDTLPISLTSISAGATQGSYDSGTGAWTVTPPTLAKDDVATLTITGTVKSNTAGQTFTNTAAISSSAETDLVPGNNTAGVAVTVQEADLEVGKFVTGPGDGTQLLKNTTADTSDTVTYTIVITNKGLDILPASSIISDTLPGNLTLNGAATASGSTGTSGNLVTWTLPQLTINEVATATITATVNAGTAGQTIANTAAVNFATQGDQNTVNNSSVATVTVNGADLELDKQVTPVLPLEGETITYTIVVTNGGPDTATGIVISDALPVGLTFGGVVAGSPTQGSYSAGVWDFGATTLAKDATATLNFTATVGIGTAGQTLVNTAAISSAATEDGNTGNNAATATLTVASFDLAITKSAVRNNNEANGVITYTVTVVNNGPTAAPGAIIADAVPGGGVNFANWNCAGSGGVVCPNGAGANSINETTGEFPAGGQLIYTIRATLPSSDTVVTNTATVTSLNGLGDSQPDNNSATHVSQPGGDIYLPVIFKNFTPSAAPLVLPDLTIDSLVASSTQVTVTIRNAGAAAVNDAFWVDVYYGLSSPPVLYQAGDLYWGLTVANGGVPLAPGQVVVLTLTSPYYAGGGAPGAAGVSIYGQVDSFGPFSYGAVQESSEANNVSGPSTSTMALEGGPSVGGITGFNAAGLPARRP